MGQTESQAAHLILTPDGGNRLLVRDLWRYRELLMFLAWREVLLRYKQAFFGVAWALMRPVLTMLVFTVIFGRVVGFDAGGVPYSLFALSGMLVWQFFSTCVADASNSLLANTSLVTKVFFPKLILPTSFAVVNFLDLGVASLFFVGLWIFKGTPAPGPLWALPACLLWMLLLTLGFSYALAAASVRFRDVKFLVPFMLQLGLYASPIGYPISAIPERWRMALYLNPVSGLVEAWRWSIFGIAPTDNAGVMVSLGLSLLVFVGGFRFFRKSEANFADLI